jgi:RNA polymerase sigma-70 factor (ECF subfamily)
MKEAETVKSALKGDTEAFRKLVETYQESVYLLMLSSTYDEFHAQDLTQETFIRAYLNLEKLRDHTKFGHWLYGIARNVKLKWREDSHPTESLEYIMEDGWSEIDMDSALLEESLSDQQIRERLWQEIYSLPESLREAILLFYVREMDRKAVASALGITESAVRNRLHRARKILKEGFEMLEKNSQNTKLPDDFTDKVMAEAMKQGEAYLREKQWQEAKQAFLRAVDVKQDYAPAYRGIGLAARGQILDQLNDPEKSFDRKLFEEAIEELSRAYRLGDREWDTVQALGNLYEKFQYYEEEAELFWNYCQEDIDRPEAFESGMQALRVMTFCSLSDDNPHKVKLTDTEIVKRHHQIISQFSGKVPIRKLVDSFINTTAAYDRAELTEEWLKESERIALPHWDELWPHPLRIYTVYRTSKYAWKLKRTEYGVKLAEEFIEYARNHPDPHPYRRDYMLDVYGQPLLASYAMLKRDDKVEIAIADIDHLLDTYKDEWHEMQSKLEAMSDEQLREWDKLFGDFESSFGNKEKERYPVGGDKKAIRQWLDMVYQNAIDVGLHQMGCVFGWKGDGERCLKYFLRKSNQTGAIHNMFMAEWMLLFRDRKSALEYVKRAAEDRHAVVNGFLKFRFNQGGGFKAVQDDPDFLAIVNVTL